MIDMHTHILPSVDDGCQSLLEARDMLRMEILNGVDTVILTPHFSLGEDKDKLYNLFLDFKKEVIDIPIKLYFGAEILYRDGIIDAAQKKELITLGDSNYVLIEFDFIDMGYPISDCLYDINCSGYKVILAHPERYSYLSIDELIRIHNLGIIFQVNTSSLLGRFGLKIKRRAKKMAKLGLIDIIASDCHSSKKRVPNLTNKFDKYISKSFKVKV